MFLNVIGPQTDIVSALFRRFAAIIKWLNVMAVEFVAGSLYFF